MGRVIQLTPAAFSLHKAQSSLDRGEAQELNAAQVTERPPERDHAYLRLDERPTDRAIRLATPPVLENGTILYDSGKFVALPFRGEPIGHFQTSDEAELALREHRAVDGVLHFLGWLGGLGEGGA